MVLRKVLDPFEDLGCEFRVDQAELVGAGGHEDDGGTVFLEDGAAGAPEFPAVGGDVDGEVDPFWEEAPGKWFNDGHAEENPDWIVVVDREKYHGKTCFAG